MTNKEYRENAAISRSELWQMNKTPLHFKYNQEHPKEDTPSLAFGRACHKYILEKDDFSNEFVVAPKIDGRTKAGKEEWAHFTFENMGKEIITGDDMAVIEDMAEAINSVPIARELLTGIHEKSFFWTDEETGVDCKCRPDCLSEYEGKKYIVDYKTTDSCEDRAFERSVRKYGYKFQAGMYREGVFKNTFDDYGFAFVAQEKKAPYAVRVYICTPEFIDQGYDQFRELIGKYKDCCETGNWYGYEGPMGLPSQLVEDEYE